MYNMNICARHMITNFILYMASAKMFFQSLYKWK